MNLHNGLERYISAKVDSGVAFSGGSSVLRAFEKRIGNIPLNSIGEAHVQSFLEKSRVGPTTWRNKYFYLFRFFQYCYARDFMLAIKMPENRRPRPPTYVPHIYTRQELKKMLKVIPKVQKGRREIESETLRSLLLFLYGTGVTPTEALSLQIKDFDWKNKQVAVFTKNLGCLRQLPLGHDLYSILHKYCVQNERERQYQPMFRMKDGGRILPDTLHRNFRDVLRAAGIAKPGGAKLQPRLLDIRHTFAVHRITSWLKQRADMNRMIPALSMYLGFVSLSTAERYFRFTPERFKQQLDLLLPTKKHPKWRDNVALMKFLDGL